MKKLTIVAILVVIAGLMIPMSMAAADPNILEGTVTDANGVTHDIGVTESGTVSGPEGVKGCVAACLEGDFPVPTPSHCEKAQRCVAICSDRYSGNSHACGGL